MVSSVTGSTVVVSQAGRDTSVNLAAAHIAQLVPAQPSDVTVSSCVRIRPTRDSADSQTPVARTVLISTPANGHCTDATPSTSNARAGVGLHGAVTAVAPGTLTLDGATVSVNQNTAYLKRSTATIQAVTNGQCLSARGTNDPAGALQAAAATVRSPDNGRCPSRS